MPATVVAETWRGPSTHARAAHLFGSVDGFPELNEQSARRVGTLLALSKTATIVTSDVNDITHLLASAKISHAMMGARGSASVDVVIVRV